MNEPTPPPCPSSPDGKHGPHWQEWRVAEREGRPIPCEYCGVDVWPVCLCGQPEVGWVRHAH
jgi:hypothetical protein